MGTATAQVTLKLSPYELQILDLALSLLVEAARRHVEGSDVIPERRLTWSLFDGDPRRAALQCLDLRADLGLH